ncbi:MAG: hypothetical protein V4717_20375 [Bacteroidota bacterium]
MDYSTAKLATAADCDFVIDRTSQDKAVLQHKLGGLVIETSGNERSLATVKANLISVNAQITGFSAAMAELPEGPDKADLVNKIRKLNDRKENLEESLAKTGSTGLLLTQLQRGMLEKQVAEIDLFVTAVETRKAAI